jgi:hypothetical protein
MEARGECQSTLGRRHSACWAVETGFCRPVVDKVRVRNAKWHGAERNWNPVFCKGISLSTEDMRRIKARVEKSRYYYLSRDDASLVWARKGQRHSFTVGTLDLGRSVQRHRRRHITMILRYFDAWTLLPASQIQTHQHPTGRANNYCTGYSLPKSVS